VRAPRLTLAGAFVAALAVIAALLAALGALVLDGSRRSILASAEKLRDAAARRVEAQVRSQLDGASEAALEVEREIALGVVQPRESTSVEAALFRQMVRNPNLAEVTLVQAERTGFDEHGAALLAPRGRWQMSVFRSSSDPSAPVLSRRVVNGRSELRMRPAGGTLSAGKWVSDGAAPDPTDHLTFSAAASRAVAGSPIWTDLAWSQLDAALPPDQRRVIVSMQKAVQEASGRFIGVVRAALLASAIDAVSGLRPGPDDPHRVFICDADGRLITRLAPADRLELVGDELRITPATVPRPIALALKGPLRDDAQGVERSGELNVDGERWLATFRALEGSQEWFAGVVVPESAYTRELHALRLRLILASAVVIGLVLLGGGAAVMALRRGLGRIHASAARMRMLEFAPASTQTPFRDVQEVLSGMEQAKTALRAMGKYAPLDLVRELYAGNREPMLGGELRELSVLFSDLEGFTSLSERLSPDELARALGLYLAAMTAAIRSCGGTIDKFIGDAVMALWNAPSLRSDHARLACGAILACKEAAAKLYASAAWAGLPPLRTRFGLHRDIVLVGHFGAPERFSYTALGDGVNLASRLEGLGKQYGVDAVVSEAVVRAVGSELAFRRLDRVAVKGRAEGVLVYELLGRADVQLPNAAAVSAYREAFDAYVRRDFAGAIARLEQHPEDGPSRMLLARCHGFLREPPSPQWDGVHVATAK
jgi:adenylate cyclase